MTEAVITSPLQLAVAAFLIGLSGAMAPGPYLTLTITRTLRQGRLSAMLMLVGHALLEALLLIGFAFGLQTVLRQPTVAGVLALAGGAVLLYLGGSLLVGAVRGTISADFEAAEDTSKLGPVAQGALVSLANPYWTLWWATIGVKLAADGLAMGPIGIVAFFVGHELADIAWYGVVVFTVASGRHLLSNRLYRGILGACAVFLLYLGVRFVAEGWRW